jgi:hypothetical protein
MFWLTSPNELTGLVGLQVNTQKKFPARNQNLTNQFLLSYINASKNTFKIG